MPSHPALLVDLSNVCRDEDLVGGIGAADWGAYERLMTALNRSDISFSTVRPIADRSLFRFLDPPGRTQFRRLERAGNLEVSELADERLLAYAFDVNSQYFGALIVSKDRFSDFRRAYPDIQGCRDRFIAWRVGRDRVVHPFFRDMGIDRHATMSRKEESGELKARRLRREEIRRKATASYYRCVNGSCLIAKLWPEHLSELPLYDDRRNRFVCPACRRELLEAGPRPDSIAMIVFVDGAEHARILLQRGESLAIGRTDGDGCLGLQRLLPRADPSAVSRRHLEVAWLGGQIQVRDLGSKNGTLKIEKRNGQPHRLERDAWSPLRRGQTILLPSEVSIELSGREVAFDGERPLSQPPDRDTDSPTRLVR